MGNFPNTIYLKRNLVLAKAEGASANTKAAIARLEAMRRPPKWLVEALHGIQRRVDETRPELLAWRDEAPDKPVR